MKGNRLDFHAKVLARKNFGVELIWVQSLYYDIKIEKLWTDMIFLD